METNEFDAANEKLQQALEINPDYTGAFMQLAILAAVVCSYVCMYVCIIIIYTNISCSNKMLKRP